MKKKEKKWKNKNENLENTIDSVQLSCNNEIGLLLGCKNCKEMTSSDPTSTITYLLWCLNQDLANISIGTRWHHTSLRLFFKFPFLVIFFFVVVLFQNFFKKEKRKKKKEKRNKLWQAWICNEESLPKDTRQRFFEGLWPKTSFHWSIGFRNGDNPDVCPFLTLEVLCQSLHFQ